MPERSRHARPADDSPGPHYVFGYQDGEAKGGLDDLLGTFETVEAARAEAATLRLRLDRTYVASADPASGELRITWEPPHPMWAG